MAHRDQTLSEINQRLWVEYQADMKIRRLSQHSVKHYWQSLWDADQFFKAPFEKLTKRDIKRYLADRADTLADSTIHIRYVDLRVFYNWMVAEDIITTSPLKDIPEPQVSDNPPRIVDSADVSKLLKTCSGTSFLDRRDNAFIRLMLEPGGPRRAEMIGMEVESVEAENELVRIVGKGGKVRYLPYGARTGQALLRYLRVRESHKHASASNLWLGRRGPLSIHSVSQMLEARCERAGIERIKPHGLRHKAADTSMAAGISDLDMMTLFGWSSPRMLEVYARSNRTARAINSAREKAVADRY